MTDAHTHFTCGDNRVRELLIGRDFIGVHPWEAMELTEEESRSRLVGMREQLAAHPEIGVGEIGLDRLRIREIPPRMRELFIVQLELAAEFNRPVVLHGAKCWGQVVTEVAKRRSEKWTAPILFHGFSRSDGLIPDIVALNGYISVGPAVINTHAVNYCQLVRKIPLDRLLLETDRDDPAKEVSIFEIANKTAALREITPAELEGITDRNADAFCTYLQCR